MDIKLIKVNGQLVPFTDQDKELIDSLPKNQLINCAVTKKRNIKFHRKFYSLLNYAYDLFEPPEIVANGRTFDGNKDFEEFRKWLIVKAGYFDVIGYPDDSVRVRAKSISFGKMEEEEFERVYNNCINVVIKYLCQNYTEEELKTVLDNVMSYT